MTDLEGINGNGPEAVEKISPAVPDSVTAKIERGIDKDGVQLLNDNVEGLAESKITGLGIERRGDRTRIMFDLSVGGKYTPNTLEYNIPTRPDMKNLKVSYVKGFPADAAEEYRDLMPELDIVLVDEERGEAYGPFQDPAVPVPLSELY